MSTEPDETINHSRRLLLQAAATTSAVALAAPLATTAAPSAVVAAPLAASGVGSSVVAIASEPMKAFLFANNAQKSHLLVSLANYAAKLVTDTSTSYLMSAPETMDQTETVLPMLMHRLAKNTHFFNNIAAAAETYPELQTITLNQLLANDHHAMNARLFNSSFSNLEYHYANKLPDEKTLDEHQGAFRKTLQALIQNGVDADTSLIEALQQHASHLAQHTLHTMRAHPKIALRALTREADSINWLKPYLGEADWFDLDEQFQSECQAKKVYHALNRRQKTRIDRALRKDPEMTYSEAMEKFFPQIGQKKKQNRPLADPDNAPASTEPTDRSEHPKVKSSLDISQDVRAILEHYPDLQISKDGFNRSGQASYRLDFRSAAEPTATTNAVDAAMQILTGIIGIKRQQIYLRTDHPDLTLAKGEVGLMAYPSRGLCRIDVNNNPNLQITFRELMNQQRGLSEGRS